MPETKITPAELEKRMTPHHLQVPESTSELKREIQEQHKAEAPVPRDDPKTRKEYTFDFEYKSQGKVWKGQFTNRILTMKDRQLSGVMRARMAAGLPSESLDALTAEINLMIAHLTFSLDETDRPDWAKDLRDIEDVRLLQALYEEVASHEATFFGWGANQA